MYFNVVYQLGFRKLSYPTMHFVGYIVYIVMKKVILKLVLVVKHVETIARYMKTSYFIFRRKESALPFLTVSWILYCCFFSLFGET